MTLAPAFNRSRSELAMDTIFGSFNQDLESQSPFEEFLEKDNIVSPMEIGETLFDSQLKSELDFSSNFIDDFLAEISSKSDAESPPGSPFSNRPLSIPSPASSDYSQFEKDLVEEEQNASENVFAKLEPQNIGYEISMGSPEHIQANLASLAHQGILDKDAHQIIYINEHGEQIVFQNLAQNSGKGLERTQLPSTIKTEASSPRIQKRRNDHRANAKKEQNKLASQRYREKKRRHEKDAAEQLQQLVKDKAEKEKELSKIQGKNECLVESIEGKFAHLF